MKVVIPLAGKGTRLRPHTHITPKPMLKIAGKPVIDYVMDDLERLGDIGRPIAAQADAPGGADQQSVRAHAVLRGLLEVELDRPAVGPDPDRDPPVPADPKLSLPGFCLA